MPNKVVILSAAKDLLLHFRGSRPRPQLDCTYRFELGELRVPLRFTSHIEAAADSS